jgi:hypothetical protein
MFLGDFGQIFKTLIAEAHGHELLNVKFKNKNFPDVKVISCQKGNNFDLVRK